MTNETSANPLRLAELMAARLCHDLSGPVGPMAGMRELAQEDPSAAEEALTAARETTDSLVARIRLFRAAWGGDCGPMEIAAISALVANGTARKRVSLEMSGFTGPAPANAPLAPPMARLLLNVLMLGVESLPGGGTLACARQPDGDIVIRITGPRAAWPPRARSTPRVPSEPVRSFRLPPSASRLRRGAPRQCSMSSSCIYICILCVHLSIAR